MRSQIIKTIFRKEIREVLRDKRMLYLIILLPFFLYPVLFTLIGSVGNSQQKKLVAEKVQVFLNPEGEATPVYELLKSDTSLLVEVRTYDAAAIDSAQNTIGVLVDPDFAARQGSQQTASVKIYVDNSKEVLESRANKIRAMLGQLDQQLLAQRLQTAQLEDAFVKPLEVQEKDLASDEQMLGKVLGSFLPMILLLFIFIGCIYIAIDITAGEKERRTLQTLFTTPVTTREIIAGKFAAVFSVGLVSALMNVLSLLLAMFIQIKLMSEGGMPSLSLNLSPEGWAFFLLIVLLSTVFLAAISLAVVLLANSYKEAQSYVSPLMMLVLIPAILSQMPGMELNATTALIPMLNISLAMGAVIKGGFDMGLVALVAFFLFLYAGLALFLASLTFGNENVVTGEKVDFKSLFSRK